MKLTITQVPDIDDLQERPEHMCAVCNRNTSGCERVRLMKDDVFVASIHAECAFGAGGRYDAIVESIPVEKGEWEEQP